MGDAAAVERYFNYKRDGPLGAFGIEPADWEAFLAKNPGKRFEIEALFVNIAPSNAKKLAKDLEDAGLASYLYGSPKSVKAWERAARHADEIRLNTDFLSKLSKHLDDYPNLDIDIDNPLLFDAYKKIYQNPESGYEILKELADDVTDEIQTLAKSEFFKAFVIKGRQFNKNVVDNLLSNNVIKNKLQQLFPGINLNEYQLLTEVQLYTINGFTKADILLVKKTGNTIEDVIYIENKLSKSTTFTTRQKEGLTIVKNKGQLKVKADQSGILLKNMILPLPKNKCLKISDHGNSDISELIENDINLIDFNLF